MAISPLHLPLASRCRAKSSPNTPHRRGGIDHNGAAIETAVTVESALTIFLNSQEIVTAMTIADHPEYLALGYLLNQNMLKPDDVIASIDYDEAGRRGFR